MVPRLILVFVVSLVLALCGCANGGEGNADAEQSASILSATALGGVAGADGRMSAGELRATRPALEFVPYGGYSERVDSGIVSYAFDNRLVLASSVVGTARPASVVLTREFPSESTALQYWRSAVERVISRHGDPDECRRIDGAVAGRSATWTREDLWLQIAVRRPVDTGPRIVPDRVMIYAERQAPRVDPGTPAPCGEVVK